MVQASRCCHCTIFVVDACRFCWVMAMQLQCCRLCCSLPQPSWSSSASQSLSPSLHPCRDPGRPCKGTLRSSEIGTPSALSASYPPPPPPPENPHPPPLHPVFCRSRTPSWVVCSLSMHVQMSFSHVQLLFVLAPRSARVSGVKRRFVCSSARINLPPAPPRGSNAL